HKQSQSWRIPVKGENRKDADYSMLGVVVGILIVIATIVWVTMLTLSRDDDASAEGITWVG
ncbi:MAG: hypothetical protein J7M24_04100, partial [Candidatus Latescibacteria bacterium]|nr:hypothetical protein [Candidatus Latescibacterota bacterium]